MARAIAARAPLSPVNVEAPGALCGCRGLLAVRVVSGSLWPSLVSVGVDGGAGSAGCVAAAGGLVRSTRRTGRRSSEFGGSDHVDVESVAVIARVAAAPAQFQAQDVAPVGVDVPHGVPVRRADPRDDVVH